MKDCFRDFLQEGPEHVGVLERQALSRLRGDDCDALAAYRAVHTLKGVFGFLGFDELAKLAHEIEESLEAYKRPQAGRLPESTAQRLAEFGDLVEQQLLLIQNGLEGGKILKVELHWLEERKLPKAEEFSAAAVEKQNVFDSHLKVPASKLDSLLEALGELAIMQAQLDRGLTQGRDRPWLEAHSGRLRALCHNAHELTLRLRMVPIEPIFHRCERQALDLAKRLHKSVRVTCEGGQTEIDKSVAEALQEPLLHLLRNALDHGFESEAERQVSGKDPQGQLRLSASHQGGDFVLSLEDDGSGLDMRRLRKKAENMGFLQPEESVDPERLSDLIFEAGFSTAETVSDISGRGVGLDSVRGVLRQLKGQVSVHSEEGRGCRFVMRLPLTLAQVDALQVVVGTDRYLLPANQVRRIISLEGLRIHEQGTGQRWIEHEGRSLSLISLGAISRGGSLAVQIDTGNSEGALLVDAVLGKQQSVVKSMGPLVNGRGPFAGGAVLDDGRVGFILDLESLLHPLSRSLPGAALGAAHA